MKSKTSVAKQVRQLARSVASRLLELLKLGFDVPEMLQKPYGHFQETSVIGPDETQPADFSASASHIPIIRTSFFVYAVAHFDAYLNDLTGVLLKYYWQTLKTAGKTLTYEEILRYDDLEALKDDLIDKEVMVFSHLPIDGKIAYYENKFKIRFTHERQQGVRNNRYCVESDELNGIFAARNVIMHNGGIVNDLYIKTVRPNRYKKGDRLEIDKKTLTDAVTCLFRVSCAFEQAARCKLNKK